MTTKKAVVKKAAQGLTFGDAMVGARRLGVFKDPIAEGLKKAKKVVK